MKATDVAAVQGPAAKIRVILVEDHPVLRAGVATLLREQSDLELVGEANDGVKGVELAQQLNPDVVISARALSRPTSHERWPSSTWPPGLT